MRDVRAQLPFQSIVFHPRHYEAVTDGSKRTTVRWGEDIRTGPALLTFDAPDHRSLRAHVVQVDVHDARFLSASDVHEDPTTDMADFVEALRRNYYPDMPDDAQLQVVTFRLADDPA